LRRILVRLQGAPKGAYCLYVTFGATPKTGQKTSKHVDLFISEALTIDAQIDQAVFCNLKAAGCDIHRRKAKAPSIGI